MIDYIKFSTEIINAFLHVYIGFVFYATFWNVLDKKKLVTLILGLCTLILSVSLLLFKGSAILYIPMFTVTFVITFLYKSKLINKVLCTILYLAINSIVELLVGFSISILFKSGIDVFTNYSAFHVSGMLVSKFIIFLIVLIIRFRKHNFLLQQYKIKYISIFLIPISTLVITLLQCKIFVEYPEQDITTKALVIISYAALIIANIIVFDFIDSLYKNTLNESKLNAANEIIASQTSQYQALIDHNKNIIKLRHDHKNFCIGLMTELKSGHVEDAITRLDKEYDVSNTEYLMQGSIVNFIINIKQAKALQHNIEVVSDCNNIGKINVAPTDLAIVIGNAFDNAIEACASLPEGVNRFIEVFITLKHEKVYISVKNPVCNDINIDSLFSSKTTNVEQHGFGIISMKQIAEKYKGEVLFSCKDKLFTATVILNNFND